MRVLFAGTPQIAVPTLDALMASGADIAAVLTRPDAAGRRGSAVYPSPVKVRALELGLKVMEPLRASDPAVADEVRDLRCDVAAVVAYGQILRPALLDAVTHGWLNLHFSVLPAWRGAAPVQRAIMAGDDVTGATTFVIDEGLDTGPVIGRLTETIRASDTAEDLLGRLSTLGAPLMVESLAAVLSGKATPIAQVDDGISYAAKLTRDDAEIRWDLPAHVVERRIRGLTPAPGAWTTLPNGIVAKVGPITLRPDLDGGVPGTVRAHDGAVVVATGTHPVALGSIAPSGKPPLDAAAWWRGARLADGAQLGEA